MLLNSAFTPCQMPRWFCLGVFKLFYTAVMDTLRCYSASHCSKLFLTSVMAIIRCCSACLGFLANPTLSSANYREFLATPFIVGLRIVYALSCRTLPTRIRFTSPVEKNQCGTILSGHTYLSICAKASVTCI